MVGRVKAIIFAAMAPEVTLAWALERDEAVFAALEGGRFHGIKLIKGNKTIESKMRNALPSAPLVDLLRILEPFLRVLAMEHDH